MWLVSISNVLNILITTFTQLSHIVFTVIVHKYIVEIRNIISWQYIFQVSMSWEKHKESLLHIVYQSCKLSVMILESNSRTGILFKKIIQEKKKRRKYSD